MFFHPLAALGPNQLRLAAVLGILARLRKIRVGVLEHGILIAMPELLLHTDVTGNSMIFSF